MIFLLIPGTPVNSKLLGANVDNHGWLDTARNLVENAISQHVRIFLLIPGTPVNSKLLGANVDNHGWLDTARNLVEDAEIDGYAQSCVKSQSKLVPYIL